jgi:hypothetical protein
MSLNSLAVTRFSGGVNASADNTIWGGSMPFIDPTLFHVFDEDFDYFLASDWTITETQAGATQALTAGNNGLLLLTNSAADNDINQVQKLPANFLPVVGKKFFMKCIFQLSDVIESDFAIGIQNANVDGTTLATATDGIFFLKVDGAATIALYSRLDNATGSVNSGAIATLVNATAIQLACFYDGVDRLYYAVNNVVTGYITVSVLTLPNVVCAPIFSLKNGEAVAKTATPDKLYIAQER